MFRTLARTTVLATVLATAVAVAGSLAAATPALADTAAAGSVVVTESTASLQDLATAGIVAVPLSAASVTCDAAGSSATFAVTDGTGDLANFYGTIALGGGVRVADARTRKSVSFHQLAFSIDQYALVGVPDGSTIPVALLDVAGGATTSPSGVLPETLTAGFAFDAAGAAYLNSALKTGKFAAGQAFGSVSISFTPAS